MPDFPLVPETETPQPAPSVTVNQISNTYAFGTYSLTTEVESDDTSADISLTLEDDGSPLTGVVITARVWLIDGDLDPLNNADDVFKVTTISPDTLPAGPSFSIALIDGLGEIHLEHNGSLRSWYVLIEINSYLTILGPYNIGV